MQTNLNQDHNHIYSQLLDFIKYYGWEKFYNDKSTDLENDWKDESQGLGIEENIMLGLKVLHEKVINSLEIISSDLCINIDPEEIMNNEFIFFSLEEDLEGLAQDESSKIHPILKLNEVFNILNDLVYLNEAVNDFSKWKFFDEKLKEIIRDKVNELYEFVLIEKSPSYLRLIPLNTIRRQRLENIPSSKHYLFPWYTEYVDIQEEALSIIVDKLSGTSLNEEFLSIEDFNLLMHELPNDEALYTALQEKAEIFRLLPTAIDQAYAFRWLTAADNAAGSFLVSKQVSELGLIGAAIRVTVNTILYDASAYEMRFRSGFCGTGLDDEQRIHLLKPIEIALKENPDLKWEGSFHIVEKWLKENDDGVFGDDRLADTLLKGWLADLNAVAEQGFKQLFLEKDIYWLLLKTENPFSLAKAIRNIDFQNEKMIFKNISKEILSVCPIEKDFQMLRNTALFYSKQKEKDSKLNTRDDEPREGDIPIAFVSVLESKKIKESSKMWISSEAGKEMTADDLPIQENEFALDDGYINVTCKWYKQEDLQPPTIEIEWSSERIDKNELWARFIHPENNHVYSEVFLGDLNLEEAGGVSYSMKIINFDPTKVKWAMVLLIVEKD